MEMGDGLTSGSALKYQMSRRESTTKNTARKDSLRVISSGMATLNEVKGGNGSQLDSDERLPALRMPALHMPSDHGNQRDLARYVN